jgi:hypothetical protein
MVRRLVALAALSTLACACGELLGIQSSDGPAAPADAGTSEGAAGRDGASDPDAEEQDGAHDHDQDAGDGAADGEAAAGDAGPLRVYVSSTAFIASQAQTACANHVLSGKFVPWLSTSTTNAIARLTTDGRFVDTKGKTVASNKAQLVLGMLTTALHYDDQGNDIGSVDVWTGTSSTGLLLKPNCGDFTSTSDTDQAEVGQTNQTDNRWTAYGPQIGCNNSFHVYCFETR